MNIHSIGRMACLLWGAVIQAQDAGIQQVPDLVPQSDSAFSAVPIEPCIHANSGSLRGYADQFEVAFGDRSVDFLPSLGVQTERPHGFGLTFESLRRGEGRPVVIGRGERSNEDLQVRYQHPGCVEVYDLLPEGLEQSFVLAALPPGDGELIVRVALSTDFVVEQGGGWSEEGLEYSLPVTSRRITVGAVTGIDAEGDRVRGALRHIGGGMEFSLPASWIESAALPITVDPVIGSAFEVSTQSAAFDHRRPDVAFDESTETYCIVFEREVAGISQIRARGLTCRGTERFPLTAINSSSTNKFLPHCANIALQTSFAIVWGEANNIRGTAITAQGVVYSSAGINIRATSDVEVTPDIGGESTSRASNAHVVWWNATTQNVEASQFSVNRSLLSIRAFSFRDITQLSGASTVTDRAPTISTTGGSTGYHLIAWQRDVNGDPDIRGMVVDRNLVPIQQLLLIENNNGPVDHDPVCDGDGRNWAVVWERSEAGSTSNQNLHAATVHLRTDQTGAYIGGRSIVVDRPGLNEYRAAVAWGRRSVLVAYDLEKFFFPNIYEAVVTTIDPYTAERLTSVELVESGTNFGQNRVAVAAREATSTRNDDALIVWSPTDQGGGRSSIRGRCWNFENGKVSRLGGGCGSGGEAEATHAKIGNSGFRHRLRYAPPGTPVSMLLSFSRIAAPCGLCTLVANPVDAVVLTATTDGNGNAEIPMSLPFLNELIGVRFLDQWLVPRPTPACMPIMHDLSTGIFVTIE